RMERQSTRAPTGTHRCPCRRRSPTASFPSRPWYSSSGFHAAERRKRPGNISSFPNRSLPSQTSSSDGMTPCGCEKRIRGRPRSDGTPISARTYRYTPVPVPEEIADSIISFETMVLEQWLPRGRAEEAAREHLIIPESFPPISNVVLGRDDSVWLRKEDSGETTVRGFVLDAAGRLQAALRA